MRAQIRWLVAAGVIGLAGCESLQTCIGYGTHKPGEVVTPNLAPASVEAAKRVDKVGRQLLAANPMLGLEVTFQTVGLSDPEIFHRDANGVFITEALVNLCKTDDQLAAVLASEMGQMVSEQRTRERMRIPEPIPPGAGGPKLDGSTDYDPARDMELAMYDKQRRKPSDRADRPGTNPKAISESILKDANIETRYLAEVDPLLKQASRNHALAKQFGGAGGVPRWTN